MLINVKYGKKFIFISNTKSASTSVEAILDKYCHIAITDPPVLKHMSYQDIVSNLHFLFSQPGCKIHNFYKFGIIRDPIDWVISWFNYRSRSILANPQHSSYKNYLGNVDFDTFVANLEYDWLKPQSNLFIDKHGNNAMDYLIRYENLAQDFEYVMKEIGLEEKLAIPHKNRSANLRVKRENISVSSQSKIQSFFAKDYDFIHSIRKENIEEV